MDPFLRDEIQKLRSSEDETKHGQATILEVLDSMGDKLDKNIKTVERIEAQTIKTNGRVTALENKPAVQGCPGKCVTLEAQLAAILPRLETVEKPQKIAHAVKIYASKMAVFVAAVLTLSFAFMATDAGEKVTNRFFAGRDQAIETAVKTALAERDAAKAAATAFSVSQSASGKKP